MNGDSPTTLPKDSESDPILYKDMPAATDWRIPADHINRLQQASIKTLVAMAKQAHWADIVIRINGEYRVIQADWLKHLEQIV